MVPPTFAVIVPTFRRPEWVTRCIAALLSQDVRPARVVIAIKDGDGASLRAVETARMQPHGEIVEVAIAPQTANVVGQQNVALAATCEEFVALTDDDAEPRPDWLARMIPHFADPTVGGVGGRDWQPYERWNEPVVGKLSWFGRVTGNHHLGTGPARDVDVLKGVNCCFRGDLLRRIGFDTRMRGMGTVIHWELALCFRLRREGWRLIYDPQVAVDHHVAPRKDGDTNDRGSFDRNSYVDIVHNEYLASREALPYWARPVHQLWSWSVGTIGTPGVLQIIRRSIKNREPLSQTIARFRAAREGMHLANITFRNSNPNGPESKCSLST